MWELIGGKKRSWQTLPSEKSRVNHSVYFQIVNESWMQCLLNSSRYETSMQWQSVILCYNTTGLKLTSLDNTFNARVWQINSPHTSSNNESLLGKICGVNSIDRKIVVTSWEAIIRVFRDKNIVNSCSLACKPFLWWTWVASPTRFRWFHKHTTTMHLCSTFIVQPSMCNFG